MRSAAERERSRALIWLRRLCPATESLPEPEPRLPVHAEVGALMRAISAVRGFAAVIAKGERDAGTLMIVFRGKDRLAAAYERMPQRDGQPVWAVACQQ